MKRFIIAAVVVALAAADSQACRGERRAARQSSKTVVKEKTVERAGVRPVREALVIPLTAAARLRALVPCASCK